MVGDAAVILDERREVFERITTEAVQGSHRLHADAGNFQRAKNLNEAIDIMERWTTDVLFVHNMDCDENKLAAALKAMPQHKLPKRVVVFGSNPNLSARIGMLIELTFSGLINVGTIPGDI